MIIRTERHTKDLELIERWEQKQANNFNLMGHQEKIDYLQNQILMYKNGSHLIISERDILKRKNQQLDSKNMTLLFWISILVMLNIFQLLIIANMFNE